MRKNLLVIVAISWLIISCGSDDPDPVESPSSDVVNDTTGGTPSDMMTCPSGQVLDNAGMCVDEGCDPWGATSGCAEGERCVPVSAAAGECQPTEPCGVEPACAAQNLCIGYGTDVNNNTLEFCQEQCRPGAVNDTDEGCPTGSICAQLTDNNNQPLPYGACSPVCTPFVEDTGCPQDWWCEPDNALEGECRPPRGGMAAAGESCLETTCQDGLICLGDGNDAMGNPIGATCRTICNAAASGGEAGTCDPQGTTAFGCVDLVNNNTGERLGYGACVEACDPWDSNDTSCGMGEFCFPNTEAFGTCQASSPENTRMADETCGPELGGCLDGLVCLNGTCSVTCKLDASMGDNGACPERDNQTWACQGLTRGGDPLPFGACEYAECDPTQTPTGCGDGDICVAVANDNPNTLVDDRTFGGCFEPCTFDPNMPNEVCTDPNERCVSADLRQSISQNNGGGMLNLDSDVCINFEGTLTDANITKWPLDARESCTANGLEANDFCAPSAICLVVADISPEVLCYDFCRQSAGTFNTPGHPDCRGGDMRLCSPDLLVLEGVGLCVGE